MRGKLEAALLWPAAWVFRPASELSDHSELVTGATKSENGSRMWRWLEGQVRWRTVVVALAVGLFALSGLTSMDNTLRALHRPNQPTYGISSLAPLTFHPKQDKAGEVVEVWRQADAEWKSSRPHTPLSVKGVLGVYLGFDVLLIFAYAIGLTVAARLLANRVEQLHTSVDATNTRRITQIKLAVRGLRFAIWLVVAAAIADVIEDVGYARLGATTADDWSPHGGSSLHAVFWVTFAASWLKHALLIVALAALLVGLLWKVSLEPKLSFGAGWQTIIVLRAPIALLGSWAFLLFGPIAADQGADSMLRWQTEWWELIVTILLAFLFGAALWLVSRKLLLTTVGGQPSTGITIGAAAVGALLIAAGIAILLFGWRWASVGTAFALGTACLALAGLNLFATPLEPEPRRKHELASAWAYVLFGAPLVLLGLALQRPSLVEWLYAEHPSYFVLVAVAVLAQAAGWILMAVGRGLRKDRWTKRGSATLVVLLTGSLVGFTLAVWLAPLSFPPLLGPVGISLAFLLVASAVAFGLSWLAERYSPPPAFALLHLRRTPVFLLLIAWAVIAGSTQSGTYFDVRTLHGGPPTQSVHETFLSWVDRLHFDSAKHQKDLAVGLKPAVPMVFVSTAGGGIRASYWTALALQCMFESANNRTCGEPTPETDPRRFFFAASGVSGGSVGLADYVAHVVSGERRVDWPAVHAGDDEASSMLAWLFFTDLPSALISRTGGSDRAEMLERTWERSWEDGALARRLGTADAITKNGPPVPLLLLNGTRVQDGCRLISSNLDMSAVAGLPDTTNLVSDCLTIRPFRDRGAQSGWTFGASEDLHALLCDSDVRLSTAALLSARFPWASPSGRVPPCDARKDSLTPANVVDGGYFDTSAAGTIVELWNALQPVVQTFNARQDYCVAPLLVELDNHYAGYPAPVPTRPWETNVPISTVKAARDAREADSRQAAALAFSGNLPDGRDIVWRGKGVEDVHEAGDPVRRLAELRPAAHPGTEAPLGWDLSKASIDDLTDEMTLASPANNPAALGLIQDWLRPNALACAQ
jgi:hypothetical protein